MSKPGIKQIDERLAGLDGWTKVTYEHPNDVYWHRAGLRTQDFPPFYTYDLTASARLANKLNLDFEISSAGTDEEPAIEVGMGTDRDNVTVQELISDHDNDPSKAEAYARALAIFNLMAADF